ncbi:sulfonate ABC transporter ATP-binding protein [Azospirillum baldaniorum]|uniref:ABC transporter (ATP binding protein) n=1 Tax=Azospirillum baldaniorum TaxID=1064539 RepID=A0A9P1JT12_9PROT|nr:ABC transporter ATP-binding protein [Azospirillum baldaniorum]AWJ89026.1 sulfonate ABC transporter ATP-binding protein [Azospirillum baldaniorum]TWA80589.1 sulfonate transport system ATP-binding protein [Azospirillum brasilense]CCC99218.1 putative ABC transporter (ATP binding protein) [Azospirillum baldaniorum]
MTTPGSLDLRAVGKTYAVDGHPLTVLQDIDLRIEPGEFLAIVGASGCGKSTLLRLIIGLDDGYDGDILLDGHRITGPGLERGIVFQEHRLFPWLTVEENVGIGLEATAVPAAEKRRAIREHIALVGLSGFETAYPYQLSGGMAQRAAIARGLVNRPEILLLDEPLGALDSLTRAHLQDELLRIWTQENVTMLLVTHDVEEAVYLADRVVVMEPRPGRIRRVLPVDLPRPRNRATPAFAAVKETIIQELRR